MDPPQDNFNCHLPIDKLIYPLFMRLFSGTIAFSRWKNSLISLNYKHAEVVEAEKQKPLLVTKNARQLDLLEKLRSLIFFQIR